MDCDIELVLRAKDGDDDAYTELMRRHYRGVLNYVYKFTNSSEGVEDITQEVFFRVYKSIKEYRPEAKFTTWLYKIATNLCLTRLKSNKRNLSLDEMEEKVGSFEDKKSMSGYNELYNKELKSIIFGALGKLPEKERVAITLSKYEGFSYSEVAEVLNCSLGAVKTYIFRGRVKLVEELKGYMEE